MRNNSVRVLKKLDIVEKKLSNPQSKNKNDSLAIIISIIATIISLFSIYFQFFYEDNDIKANFISANADNDSIINYKIVYHNKGNQNATILRNSIVFYQDSTDIDNKGIFFEKGKPVQTFEEEFDPIVLTPGQQIYKELNQPFDFKNLIENKYLNLKDTIRLSLVVGFINDNGTYSDKDIKMGWIKLDSLKNLQYYFFEYRTEDLKSDKFRSNTFRTEEKK